MVEVRVRITPAPNGECGQCRWCSPAGYYNGPYPGACRLFVCKDGASRILRVNRATGGTMRCRACVEAEVKEVAK